MPPPKPVTTLCAQQTAAAAAKAAKAVADAALRLASQAQGRAALNDVDAEPAVKAGFAARGALEALADKPGVLVTELDDLRDAIAAGDRAALMVVQAKAKAGDPQAKALALDAARLAAETKAGGPVGQKEVDAAVLEANTRADQAAQAAEDAKNLLTPMAPPTGAQIAATQTAAEAAIKAAGLASDDVKRANALAKAREAMAAVATALTALARHSASQQTGGARTQATTKTGTGVQAQRTIQGNVMNAIQVTAANYPNAHYFGAGPHQVTAMNNIANARNSFAGNRATKVTRMDEAKLAATQASKAILRDIAANDEPSRTAALNAAKARALADLPDATPEEKRDAVKAENELAKAIAAKAKTDANLAVTNLANPGGPAPMPAPNNPFVSAAASVDGLMTAALKLKAAVAAAAEHVDAAARNHSAAVEVHQQKNDVPALNAKNQAKTDLDSVRLALAALEPSALTLSSKAEANVKVRFRESQAANALAGAQPWLGNLRAQCANDLSATENVVAMLALIVAQSFTRAGANVATAKGRDALLDEAGKFASGAVEQPANPAGSRRSRHGRHGAFLGPARL